MLKRGLTPDYIRGLVEGAGTFTFTTSKKADGSRIRVPAFQIKMRYENKELIEGVRDYLGLDNRVYVYDHPGRDGYNRKPQAMLIVREIGNLKNIIIPFFYRQLAGNKSVRFESWLEDIGSDSNVPEGYKILYRLHKSGYYSRKGNFGER